MQVRFIHKESVMMHGHMIVKESLMVSKHTEIHMVENAGPTWYNQTVSGGTTQ